MEKFFLFIDAADDAAMFPVSKLQSVTCAADGVVAIVFAPGSLGDGQAASKDEVRLAITADSEKAVMQAIARAANATGPQYSDGVIVVCDDVESKFLDSNILSCTITLDA